jgi:diguanylate cyclase (GGDEF)-like protein/PAS domain S-box-containing protein
MSAEALPSLTPLPATAAAMLEAYPGPAIFAQSGRMLATNAAAQPLLEFSQGWWSEMQEWLQHAAVRGSRSPHLARIQGEDNNALVEWTAIAIEPGLLLLGRNVTLERNLSEVLSDSRDRFRDLVELSADLAFEVRADGNFSYLVGGLFLGYSTDELRGLRARDVQHRNLVHEISVFETEKPLHNHECWLRRKDGTRARVLISVKPSFTNTGELKAVRGCAKDVTSSAAKQEELALRQRRDQLIANFMKSVRDAKETKTALQIAAKEINSALQGSGCRIYNRDEQGELVMAVEAGAALPEVVGSLNRKMQASEQALWEEAQSSVALLGARTQQGAQMNGSIWVWRPVEKGIWPESDHALLREVADHLGIVVAQFDTQEKLRVLSECDGLTKLLNRRTFMEKLGHKLGQSSKGSALFYIDLDNFKPVNDTHGHQRGDMVIKKLADILRLIARPGDLAGRMGGDEFVLWLDAVDKAEAETLAKRLVAAGAELRSLSASPEKPLGVSVGATLIAPSSLVRVQHVMDKADNAMYTAKRGGKSTWALVE